MPVILKENQPKDNKNSETPMSDAGIISALLEGKIDLQSLSRTDKGKLTSLLTPKMTSYIPSKPTPKQAAFLLLPNKEALYGGAAGGGKMLCVSTEIITESRGWQTVGTLQESDRILALDGTWTEIEYITETQKFEKNYKLCFSGGSTAICNHGHLWTVEECKIKHKNHRKTTVWEQHTMNTEEIIHAGILMKKNNSMQKRFRLPAFKGFVGTVKELPLHPYILGYWLGDGTSARGEFTVCNEDLANFKDMCNIFNIPLEEGKENNGCWVMPSKFVHAILKKVGLLNNKHIPLEYKLAERSQRLWLLKGLMDSDGHAQERGRCEWSQKIDRETLFRDVCEILCGLGNKISVTVAPSTYNGVSFPSWRVTFTPFEEVFGLCRKNKNIQSLFHQEENKQRSNAAIYLESFEEAEPYLPMKCIRIKHSSHVFLITRQFIPTHNSEALLMAGLQYVDVKGYSGIIFRKNYSDLTKPGALIDRAKDWLYRYDDVRWDEKGKKFDFIRKYGKHTEIYSILQFGYMENENDKYNYQGGEYQFIGWDEVTHIHFNCYKYMFSRMRRLKHSNIPLRVRSASNPPDDDKGIWVYNRFVNPKTRMVDAPFIPAGMNDNPFLDVDSYEEALDELDPVTRARLKLGLWNVVRKGNMFKRDYFEIVDLAPPNRRRVRYWDMAATDIDKAKKKNRSAEPDYTVGLKLSESGGLYYLEDIIRIRKKPADTELAQKAAAISDGTRTLIREEQEPGSSGISVIDNKKRTLLRGFNYDGVRATGDKTQRASLASSAASRGLIKIVRGCRHLADFFDELESFPGGLHDDMVDGLSGAFLALIKNPVVGIPLEASNEDGSYWLDDERPFGMTHRTVRSH